jgi:hypothetical protein
MRARACLLLSAVALAGCGATAHGPTDRAIAGRAVLRRSDLPRGWRPVREGAGSSGSICRLARVARMAGGTATSDFTRRRQAELDNAVYVFRDVATARRAFRLATAPAARRCYASGQRESVARTPGDRVIGTVVRTPRMPALGDERRDEREYIVYTDHGTRLDVVLDLVLVRAGRAMTLNLCDALYGPLDARVRRRAVAAELRRLADTRR